MTTLLLARHGETDWNRRGIWQGHADPPLNDLGRAQARELAERLADAAVDAIHASDLRRAFETAEIVAERLGLPVIPDPELREIDIGSWSGLTRAQIADRFPAAQWHEHDGEPREVFGARVLGALERIARAHPGLRVLVVAHGGPVRALQRHMLGDPLPVLENGGVYRVRFQDGWFRPID